MPTTIQARPEQELGIQSGSAAWVTEAQGGNPSLLAPSMHIGRKTASNSKHTVRAPHGDLVAVPDAHSETFLSEKSFFLFH